jgi:hypothetical protein
LLSSNHVLDVMAGLVPAIHVLFVLASP